MRNTTLETEKEELQNTIKYLRRQRSLCTVFGILAVLIIIAASFPDAVEDFLFTTTVATNLVTVILTAVVVRWIS
jgi:flagellar biosynthesis component FlhA